jgi:hypothetical protein
VESDIEKSTWKIGMESETRRKITLEQEVVK